MTTKGSIGRLLSFGLLLLSLCSLASAQFSLTTTNAGGNSSQGNMFDVKALSGNVLISSFDVHVSGTHTVEIWYYTAGGSYGPWYNAGTGSQSDWTLLQTAQITGVSGTLTAMPALSTPFLIIGGQTQAFYVRSTTGSLTYTGTSTGPTPFPPFTSAASDSFLEIFWGHGGSFPFPVNYTREWNG
ncbi:MAG: hypothetical protein H6807_00015, partial [Planctomycetes bacterium]|nr:hypothetical protein [Planctomycetota bacterium]